MRIVIFTAGILTALFGILAYARFQDPSMLQGGLTLGGGWIICGFFSLNSRWHGIAGAGVLALLGGARNAPALLKLSAFNRDAQVHFQAVAAVICLVVLIAVMRTLFRERARRQIEALKRGDDSDKSSES